MALRFALERGERLPPRGDSHTLGCSPPLRSVDYCRSAIFESPLLDQKDSRKAVLLMSIIRDGRVRREE